MKLSTELRVELKLAASGFHVLVARPACWKKPPAAVVDAFKDDMDIRRPVKFAGLGEASAIGHSFRIDRPGLGEVLGRPSLDYPCDSVMGGVAIVVSEIDPPLAPADAAERIRRMRSSPAFACYHEKSSLPFKKSTTIRRKLDLNVLGAISAESHIVAALKLEPRFQYDHFKHLQEHERAQYIHWTQTLAIDSDSLWFFLGPEKL